MSKSIATRLFSALFGILLLAGCGGGGGGGTPSSVTPPGGSSPFKTGVFVDAAVSGLSFVAGTQSGITGANGSFTYTPGSNVTFSIGGVTLGSAVAQSVMTPVQLVPSATSETNNMVTNIARFLQTLDDNNNPNDGIQISTAVANLALGMSINFNQTPAAFGADTNVLNAVATLTATTSTGQISLVTAAAAQSHLAGNLVAQRAGIYTGTFSGADSGTWTVTVDTASVTTGTATSSIDGSVFSLGGQVTSSGSATLALGGVSSGASFITNSWSLFGTVSGTWSNSLTGEAGIFSGSIQ